jgi:hypothetical protein
MVWPFNNSPSCEKSRDDARISWKINRRYGKYKGQTSILSHSTLISFSYYSLLVTRLSGGSRCDMIHTVGSFLWKLALGQLPQGV